MVFDESLHGLLIKHFFSGTIPQRKSTIDGLSVNRDQDLN